ncbi:MAG: helix-turn-helix domain-containing protein [Pseudobdellovibrionaceae bacterium]
MKSEFIKIEKGLRTGINTRVGDLLFQERKHVGRSIRTACRRLKIKRRNLRRWELGLASPPADVFYGLVKSYGKDSFIRAAELDLEFQLEKYQRHLQQNEDQGLAIFECKRPANIQRKVAQFEIAA